MALAVPLFRLRFTSARQAVHATSRRWLLTSLGALSTSLSNTKMKTTSIKITLLILTLFAAMFGLCAADTLSVDVTTTPAFKAFLTNWVTAIKSKDRAKLNECIHPKWVAMMAQD